MNWLRNSWDATKDFFASSWESTKTNAVKFGKKYKSNWSVYTWTLVALAFFVTFGVMVGYSVQRSFTHGYKDNSGQWFKDENDASWGKMPAGYLALFFLSIALAIALIIGFAGWLRGSNWINKSNPYIKGKAYVRTKAQTIAFRTSTLLMAGVFFWSFAIDMFWGDLGGSMKNANFADDKNPGNILRGLFIYSTSPSAWYYQCFMTSFFLGFILTFKKYNWVKIVWPMGFIGAVRTFGDVVDWVGSDGSWTQVQFHRLVAEHLLLIFGPLFIIVANRDRFTLRAIKQTFFYTFTMVFIPYAVYSIVALWSDGKPHAQGWGEIDGVASWWKLGGADTDKWLSEHFHLFFWCMYVPFGLGIVILLMFFVNFFTYKAEAKGNWGQRWASVWKEYAKDVKATQWAELKLSYKNIYNFIFLSHREKIKMPQPTPFGVDPKVWEARKRK